MTDTPCKTVGLSADAGAACGLDERPGAQHIRGAAIVSRSPVRQLAVFSTLLLLGACASMQPGPESGLSQVSPKLLHIAGDGEFIEVQRTAEHSIVEVPQSPAGSVAASLFALRGACAVALARGEPYFTSSAVPAGVRTYRLTFPKSPTDAQLTGSAKSVFSRSDCSLLRF